MCVCTLPFRLDTIVGPPQTLSSKAKTFSSPSLHSYYSQAKRKHSAPGSADPQSPSPTLPAIKCIDMSHMLRLCVRYITDKCLNAIQLSHIITISSLQLRNITQHFLIFKYVWHFKARCTLCANLHQGHQSLSCRLCLPACLFAFWYYYLDRRGVLLNLNVTLLFCISQNNPLCIILYHRERECRISNISIIFAAVISPCR